MYYCRIFVIQYIFFKLKEPAESKTCNVFLLLFLKVTYQLFLLLAILSSLKTSSFFQRWFWTLTETYSTEKSIRYIYCFAEIISYFRVRVKDSNSSTIRITNRKLFSFFAGFAIWSEFSLIPFFLFDYKYLFELLVFLKDMNSDDSGFSGLLSFFVGLITKCTKHLVAASSDIPGFSLL